MQLAICDCHPYRKINSSNPLFMKNLNDRYVPGLYVNTPVCIPPPDISINPELMVTSFLLSSGALMWKVVDEGIFT
jgi:hypothetical protein